MERQIVEEGICEQTNQQMTKYASANERANE